MFVRLIDPSSWTLPYYIYTHNGHESFQVERPEAARVGEGKKVDKNRLGNHGVDKVARSGSTLGTRSNLCAQLDH